MCSGGLLPRDVVNAFLSSALGVDSTGKYLEKTKVLLWVFTDLINDIYDALRSLI